MANFINLLIGVIVLLLGIPLGNYLAKYTKEELKSGQKWFKLIIIFSLAGALISLIAGDDVLLFSFLFIAIVTNKSLKR
jgi:formate hydrogenlyase subunit 3/multisubunit Na+/H+ antiporter MnhD subunit